MIKVLFLIHDLGQGGAEKVLVNLVNHMDRTKFDISVTVLFGGGVNEQFLNPDIHFHAVFPKMIPGNSKWMKLFTPEQLHHLFIKDQYDIEVSYLEGPSSRVISGCTHKDTKLVSWVHCTMHTQSEIATSFRNFKEAKSVYNRFDAAIYVSQEVKEAFQNLCPTNHKKRVCYNTVETTNILMLKDEPVEEITFRGDEFKLIGVGKLEPNKGFDRLARIHKRLREQGYPVHTYVLGTGSHQHEIEMYIENNSLEDSFTFLGYQTNPYKYVSQCDLFVCSSFSEGFSTAATEALILGIPVCTVDVSGMREMLGENNEYGIITENDEESLFQGIKQLLDNTELMMHYRRQARSRGMTFNTENTVKAVEKMLQELNQVGR